MPPSLLDMLALPSNNYHYDDEYGYGGASHGHGSFSGGGDDCCPLVVDPLTYLALMKFLAAATYFFQQLIAMSMLMMAGRKKRSFRDICQEGTIKTFYFYSQNVFV